MSTEWANEVGRRIEMWCGISEEWNRFIAQAINYIVTGG